MAIHRAGLGSPQSGLLTVYPHQNWRGAYAWGSFPDGSNTYTCTYGNGCPNLDFTGNQLTVSGTVANPQPVRSWLGTLVAPGDGSGLKYLRNRYYDPASGRFTQQDPIGLAGGANLYGFAGSDQLNFSDPFGLCYTGKCLQEALRQIGHRVAPLTNAVTVSVDAKVLTTKISLTQDGKLEFGQAVVPGLSIAATGHLNLSRGDDDKIAGNVGGNLQAGLEQYGAELKLGCKTSKPSSCGIREVSGSIGVGLDFEVISLPVLLKGVSVDTKPAAAKKK